MDNPSPPFPDMRASSPTLGETIQVCRCEGVCLAMAAKGLKGQSGQDSFLCCSELQKDCPEEETVMCLIWAP